MNNFKKSIPFILLGIFISWASYKFFLEKPIKKNEQTLAIDWQELDQSKKGNNQKIPLTIKSKEEALANEGKTQNVDDQEIYQAYDEIERIWLETIKPVIGDEQYGAYLELREKNEKEKMDAYKAYHEFLRQKYGDKFEYNISEDQSAKEKEINQAYLKKLLTLIGPEKFQIYLKAKDQYNEGTRRSGQAFLPMEF